MDYAAFASGALSTPVGETALFPTDLIPCQAGDDFFGWESVVRYLEGKGVSIAAATQDFPEGVYIAEGLEENGALKGWGLGEQKPTHIVVKNIGWPLRSLLPLAPKTAEPGLKLVPHHTMAIVMGSRENGWEEVQYIPSSSLSVLVADTSGIQYGQSAFEGCCAMRNANSQVFGFRLDENAARFDKSIQSLDLPAIDIPKIHESIEKTIAYNAQYVPHNEEGKMYIRPSVSGLSGGLGIIVPDRFVITVEVAAFGDYFPFSVKIEGRKDIHRPYTGTNKIAPNYGASFKIKHGVKERGYSDYLSFDEDGMVEEVATCAVGFIDAHGAFIFPPVRDEIDDKLRNILPSITRKSTIEILQRQGKTVVLRDVPASEVSEMKAMFTMGNAVGILNVSEICIKENESDTGETVLFDESTLSTIKQIKADVFATRVGELSGFEDWAVRLG